MTSSRDPTRRQFLSSAIGFPMLASWDSMQERAENQPATATLNALEQFLTEDAHAITDTLETRQWPTAAALDAFAKSLRMHAAYRTAHGANHLIERTLRKALRKGLDPFIAKAQTYEHSGTEGYVSVATYVQACQRLTHAHTGLSHVLLTAAAVLSDVAARAPIRVTVTQGLSINPCPDLRVLCEMMKATAAVICALATINPAMTPICAVLGVEVAAACLISWYQGC